VRGPETLTVSLALFGHDTDPGFHGDPVRSGGCVGRPIAHRAVSGGWGSAVESCFLGRRGDGPPHRRLNRALAARISLRVIEFACRFGWAFIVLLLSMPRTLAAKLRRFGARPLGRPGGLLLGSHREAPPAPLTDVLAPPETTAAASPYLVA
jgi:hypothetical protein